MARKLMTEFDVIVIGGGMVGGSLALALGQSSLRVAVIEAKPPNEKKADSMSKRAIALSWGSRCLLEQLTLWQVLAPDAMPIKQIHVSDKGHFGKTRLSAKGQNVDALGYVVEAAQIENAVNTQLAGVNCEQFCPATLLDYQLQKNNVEVTILLNGKEKKLSCKLLVGADGGMSQVRSKGNFQLQEYAYHQHAITGLLQVEADEREVAYERFTSAGPIAMLPHFDNLYSLVWTMPSASSEELIKLTNKALVERLQTQFGRWLGELKFVTSCQRFPLNLAHVRETVSERVVLIGNAAHQLHPVAGQGFNLGLRDAAALADVLLSAQSDVGLAETLERYQAQRKTDQALITGFTDNIVKLFSNDNVAFSLLRNSGLLMLDKVPLLKNQFARQTMGLGSRLARLKTA